MQRAFDIEDFLIRALEEDIGPGDVTGNTTIPADKQAKFAMNARQELVVCGVTFLPVLFALIDPAVKVTINVEEGQKVAPGTTLAELTGPARALLAGERTALNLVQQLSGVATLTRRYVTAVEGTGATILDTRKTIPGLRHLQKYAVTCGGGKNHRMGLYDAVMIKDNHIAVAGSIAAAVSAARAAGVPVEVECDTLTQVDEALAAGADIIMFDNMDNASLREAVKKVAGRAITEASGNVSLETVRAIAETGVDTISVGKLTHSAIAVDIGLDG
jgi:nicotinate-nucleotide pyrophosphorylase (carboxylating)